MFDPMNPALSAQWIVTLDVSQAPLQDESAPQLSVLLASAGPASMLAEALLVAVTATLMGCSACPTQLPVVQRVTSSVTTDALTVHPLPADAGSGVSNIEYVPGEQAFALPPEDEPEDDVLPPEPPDEDEHATLTASGTPETTARRTWPTLMLTSSPDSLDRRQGRQAT